MIEEIVNVLTQRKSFFLNLFLEHALLAYLSALLATILGVAIGIWIERKRHFSKVIISVINFVYTIPSIAMFGFLIPIFGIGKNAAVFALTTYALLPIVLNTYTGLTNVDPAIVEAAKGMGATDSQILFRLKLPLAGPVIFSAIRNSVIMTIAMTGIAAFIGAGGLGVAIFRGITTNNIALTVLSSLLIAVFAISSDFILDYFGKHVLFSRKKISKKIFIPIVIIFVSLVGVYIYQGNDKKPKENTINVATKPMTEQYILGQIISQLIKHDTNLEVNLTEGVGGGTSNIHVGLINKNFDLYPEYTGTSWNQVLKKTSTYKNSMFEELNKEYNKQFGLIYADLYGFDNTFGLAVRKETAQKYNLKTYSDLSHVSDKLILGAEYDYFERQDGFDAFQKAYNISFKRKFDIDVALKYKALKEHQVDVIVVFTTDANLNDSEIVLLEDNLEFYPSYKAGTVVRTEIIHKYQSLKKVMKKLDGAITQKEMSAMNYEVDIKKKTAKDVAHQFLIRKGLLNE